MTDVHRNLDSDHPIPSFVDWFETWWPQEERELLLLRFPTATETENA